MLLILNIIFPCDEIFFISLPLRYQEKLSLLNCNLENLFKISS